MFFTFHDAIWRTIMIGLLIFYLPSLTIAGSKILVRDGPVTDTDLIGYIGTNYQAIRYEPLCGTLGSDSRFSRPISMGARCPAAMDVYSNNTSETLAFYDLTGVRLKNAVVGGGKELCMCFSLSQSQSGGSGIKGDICLYADGTAQVPIWWSLSLDNFLASDYRPGAYKSLPLCSNLDLDKARADWSATAVQPSVTESVATLQNVGSAKGGITTVTSISTVIQVSTFIPSVVDYTLTSIFVTTDSQGRLTTQTQIQQTRLPVVTATSQGLAQGDKIALGVGLGIGIPTILLMLVGLMHQIYKGRRRRRW